MRKMYPVEVSETGYFVEIQRTSAKGLQRSRKNNIAQRTTAVESIIENMLQYAVFSEIDGTQRRTSGKSVASDEFKRSGKIDRFKSCAIKERIIADRS